MLRIQRDHNGTDVAFGPKAMELRTSDQECTSKVAIICDEVKLILEEIMMDVSKCFRNLVVEFHNS